MIEAGPGEDRRGEGLPLRDLTGRVAVVTGGGSGIGRGIARSLDRAGATVVVADVDLPAAELVAAELQHPEAMAVQVDVTDAARLAELAEQVHHQLGRVDILVNNAGVGPLDEFTSLSLADFRWVMDINFWGVVHGVSAFLPYLQRREDGAAILNTASMAAVLPGVGITAYGASKAAVLSLSDSLRIELEPQGRVGVTVLLPARVDTNITVNAERRPGHGGRTRETSDFIPDGAALSIDEVGDLVTDGLRRGATHIFTHPETRDDLAARHEQLLAAYVREHA